MISMQQDFKRFRAQLASIPYESLLDSLAQYAVTNEGFCRHFEILSTISEKSQDSKTLLNQVKQRIDEVFGNQDLFPVMFGLDSEFDDVHVLVESLLSKGLAREVVQLVEHSFQYAENIANVQEPDDFLGDCYAPLIRCWLLAHKHMNTPSDELSKIIDSLDKHDDYGIFASCVRQHRELLPTKA